MRRRFWWIFALSLPLTACRFLEAPLSDTADAANFGGPRDITEITSRDLKFELSLYKEGECDPVQQPTINGKAYKLGLGPEFILFTRCVGQRGQGLQAIYVSNGRTKIIRFADSSQDFQDAEQRRLYLSRDQRYVLQLLLVEEQLGNKSIVEYRYDFSRTSGPAATPQFTPQGDF